MKRVPVSVVIPVYNCQQYLAEAIESIRSQSAVPEEVIVVDDGSTDDTRRVAESYAPLVRYRWQAHMGIGSARNHGVQVARCEYLAFLDADDVWTPDKTRIQMDAIMGEPRPDIVLGYVKEFVSPEFDPDEVLRTVQCRCEPMPGFHAGAMLIKHRVFMQVGLFSTSIRSGEFIDWFSRAQEMGLHVKMVPSIVMLRRLHGNNHGLRAKDSVTDYALVLKAMLDRRRLQ